MPYNLIGKAFDLIKCRLAATTVQGQTFLIECTTLNLVRHRSGSQLY